MTLRVLVFIVFIFSFMMFVVKGLQIPVDAFLVLLFTLCAVVMSLFAHYRWIGRLRSQNDLGQAIFQFQFWKLFLPSEVYAQMKTQMILEKGDESEFTEALDWCNRQGVESAFCAGMKADFLRRQGKAVEAEKVLLAALEETPPSLLRTGLLSQLSRLYIHFLPSTQHLKKCNAFLEEASEYAQLDIHDTLLQAIRGELSFAQKNYDQAIESLKQSLDIFLLQTKTSSKWKETLFRWIAQITFSEHDEHQFPLFAEFCLTLGKAYKAKNDVEQARFYLKKGLSLCQQPFLTELIHKEAYSLVESKD